MAVEPEDGGDAGGHPASEAASGRRSWWPVGLVLLLFALVAAGATWLAGRGGQHMGGRPRAAVAVAKATLADVPVRVTALGTVRPVVTATVRTQIAGTLFALDFQDGAMVRRGQLLAQIDPRPYRLALAQAEANLARDTALLAAARVDQRRYETLLAQDSIASQQVDTQRATVRQLGGTVAADQAAVGTARLNLGYTSIRSPISGRAGLRAVDLGNFLTPSDAAGIVSVTSLDPIDVGFALPQAQLARIGQAAGAGAGLPVAVYDQDNGRLLASGRFLTFDNAVDPATGTVKAKARFANPASALFPGQFVNVSMLVDTLRNAVVVPAGAVRHGAPGDFVFVLQPDRTVKLVPVQTGPGDGRTVTVRAGLKPGATVVTEGADGLEDGSAVALPGDGPPKSGHRPGAAGKAGPMPGSAGKAGQMPGSAAKSGPMPGRPG